MMTTSKIKTLVVDDNPTNMKLLTSFLEKLDCETDVAENGEKALDFLRSNQYDLCFMDIQMPVIDGIETTRIIRNEISKELPIIAITAIDDFNLDKSLAAGMNDYISKPIDFNTIKNTIPKHYPKAR